MIFLVKKRHPLYSEKNMRRNADLPIRDPDEVIGWRDGKPTQSYVSPVLFPGERFELDSHVKRLKTQRRISPVPPPVHKERKRRKKFDKETEDLLDIFGERREK